MVILCKSGLQAECFNLHYYLTHVCPELFALLIALWSLRYLDSWSEMSLSAAGIYYRLKPAGFVKLFGIMSVTDWGVMWVLFRNDF